MSERLDRAAALRLAAVAAAAAAVPSVARGGTPYGFGFPQPHPEWRFVFVNHALTNPFFVPAKYGSIDAADLLGVSAIWTGSRSSDVGEMVKAMKVAIDTRADGIAVSIIDQTAFNATTALALKHGIPVVSYNADGAKSNGRLAYFGQDLYQSGLELGARVVSLVDSGDVYLFIATPNQLNIQPRIDGALSTLKSHPSITPHVVATGAAVPAELTTINSYAVGHPNTKGLFAVDAGSTQSLAQTIQKNGLNKKGVMGGGYDLTPVTQELLAGGYIQFTIDQQPYLQGFFPIIELYLYNASQTLTGLADVNTGLKFLDKTSVVPYNNTKSPYEGTSTSAGVQKK